MKTNLIFLSIVSILICGFTARAQKGTVQGRITDSEHYSLPGAAVFIKEKTEIGTISDVNGFYRINNVPEGKCTVEVHYIGFEEAAQVVEITPGKLVIADLVLKEGIQLQEVKVNGALQGQTKALNQQKNSVTITNIISADQVERFPDANIGDALKRIPGIHVQYDQGEARFGNIRGTSPDLNSVTINGDRIPSAEAETRAIQLDLVPSDMVQTIEVNKVVTADMEGDAIGGSINLITRSKPGTRRISGHVGSGYNFLSEKPMAIGSIMYADRFFGDHLGMVLSGSYHNHKLGSDNIEAEWDQADDGSVYVKDFQVRTYELQRERQSYSAAFDLKINENHSFDLKGIYNRRKDWENRYRLRFKDIEQDDAGNWESEIRRQTKAGTGNNKYARLEDQETMNFSLGGNHHFGIVTADWKASYSKAKEERPNERYLSFRGKKVSVIPDLSDTRKPQFTVNDADYQDLNANWGLKELTEEFQYTDDVDRSFKVDFQLPVLNGVNESKLKFGFKYKGKEKQRDNRLYEYEPVDEDDFVLQATSETNMVDKSRNDFLAGDYEAGHFVRKEFLGKLALKDPVSFEETKNLEEMAGNFEASEEVYAGFVRWDQRIGEKLALVAGLRYEYTGLEYAGYELIIGDDDTQLRPTGKRTSDYVNWLPSLLLKYDLSKNTKLKLAWTNTMARPKYYDLVPHREINQEDEEIKLGNPDLNATTSMNFDIMVEHYFKSIGLVSGGFYYKDIKDFIVDEVHYDYNFEGSTYKKYERPINGGNAKLYGFETAFQRQFNFLPGFLKYLGVYANYSYNKSEVTDFRIEDRENDEVELPGTPEHTVNTSLFYESRKLTLRASLNYASAFVDEFGGDSSFFDRYYDQVTHLDLSGSYDLTKNLKVFAEVNNVLNTPLRYYQGESQYTMQSEYYGVKMQGGVRFNF
ncbi:TonB-dependent receptor [Marinilabiliaceae bacterium JC017]|nr:TonB-dependent receptor [Marinilabiliaceae bacterium JC017]